jgi:hypothetical protein
MLLSSRERLADAADWRRPLHPLTGRAWSDVPLACRCRPDALKVSTRTVTVTGSGAARTASAGAIRSS